jgi:alpha-L-fucosidase
MPKVTMAYTLAGKHPLTFTQKNHDVTIKLPATGDDRNMVVVLEYTGKVNMFLLDLPATVSSQFAENPLDAINAKVSGKAEIKPITHSNYFGDWKHTTCITSMASPQDSASFFIRVTEPGDYKVTLEYACDEKQAGQEGILNINNAAYPFQTLTVNNYDSHKPLMFIKQTVAITHFKQAGALNISVKPMREGKELFKLKTIWVDPVH